MIHVNDHPDFIFLSPKKNIEHWPRLASASEPFGYLYFPLSHMIRSANEPTLEKSMAGRNLAILHLSFVEDLDIMFRRTIEQVVL